jgi:hypothetical protein
MRYVLFALLLLVAGVVALGFYRGWWGFETTRDPETGRQAVHFQINNNKIRPDIDKVKEKIGGGSAQGGEKSKGQQP